MARGLWTKGEAQWFSQIDRTYRALGVESCRPVPLPVQTQPEGGVLLRIVSPDRVLSSEEQVGRLITALESAGLEVRTTVGFERSALTELQRFRMILYLGHSAIAESDLHLLRELPVPSVLYVDQQMQRLLIQNGALSLSLPQDTLQHESWLVRDLVRRCDYILCDASTDNSHSSDVSSLEDLRGKPLHTIDLLRPTEIAGALQSMAEDYTGQRWPKVSIVSVLYCKAGEIEGFLRAIKRQSYLGEIELVFVDDLSPDDSSQRVVNFFEEWEAQLNRNAGTESKQIPSYKLIRNDRNLGNCESRNRALDQVTGDVVVIVDADCLSLIHI